ncbi:hypothetical protein N7540_012502 [Penicillium herquei]|nr:hypothetical protein N7540_012502 [Penicillium herquei]
MSQIRKRSAVSDPSYHPTKYSKLDLGNVREKSIQTRSKISNDKPPTVNSAAIKDTQTRNMSNYKPPTVSAAIKDTQTRNMSNYKPPTVSAAIKDTQTRNMSNDKPPTVNSAAIKDTHKPPTVNSAAVKDIQSSMSCGSSSALPRLPIEDPPIARTILKLITEAARTLHQLSTHKGGVPRDVHRRILETLDISNSSSTKAATQIDWSDGSTWITILEKGAAQKAQVTIFNMLEYMGAWEWYQNQIQLAKANRLNKRGDAVNRRGATIGLLQKLIKEHTQKESRCIAGIGSFTMQDESGNQAQSNIITISDKAADLKKASFQNQLTRGGKLSTQLVNKLGLGILFSSSIW